MKLIPAKYKTYTVRKTWSTTKYHTHRKFGGNYIWQIDYYFLLFGGFKFGGCSICRCRMSGDEYNTLNLVLFLCPCAASKLWWSWQWKAMYDGVTHWLAVDAYTVNTQVILKAVRSNRGSKISVLGLLTVYVHKRHDHHRWCTKKLNSCPDHLCHLMIWWNLIWWWCSKSANLAYLIPCWIFWLYGIRRTWQVSATVGNTSQPNMLE